MVKLISVLLFLYGCAFGLDNSYKLAINGVTTATASSFISPNVGQAQHTIYVSATGCSVLPGSANAYVQGSYDNITYFAIGPAVVTMKALSASASSGLGTGSGAYPYLRVNYVSNTGTGCTISIWYTGAVNPSGVINTSNYYLTGTGSPTGAATVSLFPSVSGARFVIYGLYVINITGGTNTLNVFDIANGAACTGATGYSIFSGATISANEKIIMPTSTIPYLIGTVGSGLCMTTTGAGTTQVTVIGRYE